MQITVLIENGPCQGLACEHGLSLYVQYRGKRYLLDAGQSGLFARNAQALGLDLAAVDAAVLSHGHYDHAGGLEAFFACNAQARVYLRREATLPFYSGGETRYIGMPQDVLARFGQRFVFVQGMLELAPGLFLLPHTTPGLEAVGERAALYCKRDGQLLPDDFRHEQTAAFETPRGLVLLSRCSHAGIVHCVREAMAFLPNRRVYAVVGGFHLMQPHTGKSAFSPDVVRSLARELEALGVEQVYTGHCTGEAAYGLLQEVLGEKCHPLRPGMCIAWDESGEPAARKA